MRKYLFIFMVMLISLFAFSLQASASSSHVDTKLVPVTSQPVKGEAVQPDSTIYGDSGTASLDFYNATSHKFDAIWSLSLTNGGSIVWIDLYCTLSNGQSKSYHGSSTSSKSSSGYFTFSVPSSGTYYGELSGYVTTTKGVVMILPASCSIYVP